MISAMASELNEYNLVVINTDEINQKIDQMISSILKKNRVILH